MKPLNNILAFCMLQQVSALAVTILADTNRDGIVNNLDLQGKNNWTADHGALFLANIVDTDRRCSLQVTRQTSDAALEQCNDAADDVLRNPRYLAPLVTLPVSADGLSPNAQGFVSVVDASDAAKVRIFRKGVDGKWTIVKSDSAFTASEIKQGLQLGIDARDIRRPNGWDGHAAVRFRVSNGSGDAAEDTVALRVAPVLTHHHAQNAERVFVSTVSYTPHVQFVADLQKNVNPIMPVQVLKNANNDIWTQDFFETAYSSIPGPDGPIVVRIMLRTALLSRTAGRATFSELRDGTVGAVNTGDGGASTDSTGNLETIPPYAYNGKSYPAGRIILGRQANKDPVISALLEVQETQDPLRLDTDWLAVGHVDEFLQFLPANNKRGWVLVADDPAKGVAVLQKAVADGYGSQRAFSRPSFSYDAGQCVPKLTISQVLALKGFIDTNKLAAERIAANLEILKRETGLTDDEIVRLPATFYNQDPGCGSSRIASISSLSQRPLNILEAAAPPGAALQRRQSSAQLLAFYPGIVNGLVLNNSTVVSPNPWGPIGPDGKDILQVEAEKIYAKVGYKVIWQDDYFSHHVLLGEVHCGTNTWRKADDVWW
ncbi:arginine deiminase type-3 [Stachybotrys elegans]|uniref:Arginine deiminase type-3 n=1 Tax=Stachybotrys elegans TaxID=80388 RepID=A0A8K0WLD9_9HYPO|nr:arginine deiminase type-3 [Stachybotrys elegans]